MTNPEQNERLAAALGRIQAAANDDLIRSDQMSRTDRERAVQAGWLHPIIKGWYLLGAESSAHPGSTVLWFGHYWTFIGRYLHQRFGEGYCVNAEGSLDLHAGSTAVPRQLIIITNAGGAQALQLPHGTSLQLYPDAVNLPDEFSDHHGVRIMNLSYALTRAAPRYFQSDPVNAEIALNLVAENDLSRALIAGRNTRAAGRLMGAYQALGHQLRAERIKKDMQAAVGRVPVSNPFTTTPLLRGITRMTSPQVGRLQALWASMRPVVVERFPAPGPTVASSDYLANLQDIYQHDAYHSLSIEGYRVTAEIIAKIATGDWHADRPQDQEHIAAMAAKGYFDAFSLVEKAVARVLAGECAGVVAQEQLQDWYRALFGASVQAGLAQAADLAGYRNRAVYISGSKHVPPPVGALMDCMETYFSLLTEEPSAAVRAVLGHFFFVFIHPFPDGNGRLGRFLMNLMLASRHYPWTVIRLDQRSHYMATLEKASVDGDIAPFTDFVAKEMQVDWKTS